MPPVDALHMKQILFEDLASFQMRSYLDMFIGRSRTEPGEANVFAGSSRLNLGSTNVAPEVRRADRFGHDMSGDELADDMRRSLQIGETFYVSPDMLMLAEAASESMPDEPVYIEDIPTQHGFMWLPRPIKFMDIRGRLMTANVITWTVVSGGVVVFIFTDKHDELDMINISMKHDMTPEQYGQLKRFSMAAQGSIKFGDKLPRTIYNSTLIPPSAHIDVRWRDAPDGTAEQQLVFSTDVPIDLKPEVRRDPVLATVLAMWRLMQQTITDIDKVELTGKPARAFRKVKFRDKRVVVIQLRRRAVTHPDEPSHVEWSHRWLVRGHWRKQPCKVQGEWSHRVIWISAFIKGPEGAPLIVRDRVNALLR